MTFFYDIYEFQKYYLYSYIKREVFLILISSCRELEEVKSDQSQLIFEWGHWKMAGHQFHPAPSLIKSFTPCCRCKIMKTLLTFVTCVSSKLNKFILFLVSIKNNKNLLKIIYKPHNFI